MSSPTNVVPPTKTIYLLIVDFQFIYSFKTEDMKPYTHLRSIADYAFMYKQM